MLVRLEHADNDGMVRCYTCDHIGFWKFGGIECGHFKSRSRMSTRWKRTNARPQCTNCNQVLDGNMDVFEPRLREEIGDEEMERLDMESKKIACLDQGMVATIRSNLEKKLKKVRKEKNL